MKLDEFYNLSREESFERIKGECRSQAIKSLCKGGMILFVIISITITWSDVDLRIVPVCLLAVGYLALAWIVVNNLWFLMRLHDTATPEQLLHCYKKRYSHERNATYLAILGIIIGNPSIWNDIINLDFTWTWIFVRLINTAILIALLIYSYFHGDIIWSFMTRHDEEIIDRLEDLVGEE